VRPIDSSIWFVENEDCENNILKNICECVYVCVVCFEEINGMANVNLNDCLFYW
jgi:hypothetical protein